MAARSALAVAFGFLTRIPVRSNSEGTGDLGRATAFFPLVGLAIGAILAAAAWLAETRASSAIVATGLVALQAIVTGGLHLDGLADVFDGLGGSHGDRERMLTIMHDSRIGAHGAAALFLALIAKVIAIGAAVQRRDLLLLVVFPALARWAVAGLIVLFPYARETGLGRGFKDQVSFADIAWATALIVVVLIVAGARFIVPALAALVVVVALGAWMQRRLGGLTGDVYGAAIELAEITVLIAATQGR